MDELINELKKLTEETLQKLDELDAEALIRFVDQREKIIDRIKEVIQNGQPAEHHKEAVHEILRQSEPIHQRMNLLQKEAAVQIKKINHGKLQKQAYLQSNYYADGVFFDRKK